jgi:hypothetical protein
MMPSSTTTSVSVAHHLISARIWVSDWNPNLRRAEVRRRRGRTAVIVRDSRVIEFPLKKSQRTEQYPTRKQNRRELAYYKHHLTFFKKKVVLSYAFGCQFLMISSAIVFHEFKYPCTCLIICTQPNKLPATKWRELAYPGFQVRVCPNRVQTAKLAYT